MYILLALLFLIILFLLCPISVSVEYNEDVKVKAGYPFFRIDVLKYLEKRKTKNKARSERVEAIPKKKKTPSKKKDVMGFIRFVTTLARRVAESFARTVKVKLKYLDVRVSSDEADKTALLYGTVSGAVSVLLDVFKSFLHFKYDPRRVSVIPDFTQSEMKLKTKIIFSVRPLKGILAIINIFNFLLRKGENK